MVTWFDRLSMFRRDIRDVTRINASLTVFETDHDTRPIMIKCRAGEGDAYAALTRNEIIKLASTLNAFLNKGDPE